VAKNIHFRSRKNFEKAAQNGGKRAKSFDALPNPRKWKETQSQQYVATFAVYVKDFPYVPKTLAVFYYIKFNF